MNSFFRSIRTLLAIHVAALVVMSLLRVLTLVVVPYAFPESVTGMEIAKALLIGVWFDNVVACYITGPLILLVVVLTWLDYRHRIMNRLTVEYVSVMFFLSFFVGIVNIPYFCYYFENINASVYQWFAYLPTTVGMLVTEKTYWAYIVLIVVLFFLWRSVVRRMDFQFHTVKGISWKQRLPLFCAGLLLLMACVFGIRGRMGYNPIKISQAYFCQDPFLNQIGISPMFNMIVTTMDLTRKENRKLELMNREEAFAEVRKALGIAEVSASDSAQSLARQVAGSASVHSGKNVVIILMESMSSDLLGKGDTPFLDSLCQNSLYYTHAYSSGNHTNHGVYSTLYSRPAVMFRNMLKCSIVPHIDGLPRRFQDKGYTTLFHMTHESQYDNMNAFLRTNGFDVIRSQEDYPKEEVVNSFGVPDDFLLQNSLSVLTQLHKDGKRFFSVMLTVSNHPPYVVPEKFASAGIPVERQIVRYADWSLRHFLEAARKTAWYANTIFVLLADHGKLLKDKECELPQSFNHIPLLFFGENLPATKKTDYALQMDVAPTLLGMMGWSYRQNDFGVDLNRQQREYAFYTGDKYLAVRDSARLYLYRPSDSSEYRYKVAGAGNPEKKSGSADLVSATHDTYFQQMKKYLFSMIQATEDFR